MIFVVIECVEKVKNEISNQNLQVGLFFSPPSDIF